MKKAAAKRRRRLFSLAAVLVLAAAFLITVPAEATRTYNPPITAALQQPRLSQKMQEGITEKAEHQAENRFRLFEDLSLPPHPLEWVPLRKTASGVFHLGIECNTRETGVLVQNCSGPSFQGLWTDPTTGLSYARNRWYDARTASWLSEDPAGAVDSPNLYAFVGWAPHMGRDPMGLWWGKEDWANSVAAFSGVWVGAGKIIASPGVMTYNATGALLYRATGGEQYREQNEAFEEGVRTTAALLEQGPVETAKTLGEGFVSGGNQFLAALDEGDAFSAGEGLGDLGAKVLLLHEAAQNVTISSSPAYATATGAVVQTGAQTLALTAEGGAAASILLMSSTKDGLDDGDGQASSSQEQSSSGSSRDVPQSLTGGPESTHVYLGERAGDTVYTGITNNIARRGTEHGDRFALRPITQEPLARRQARAVEQVIKENNPAFENKINSISPKRSWYSEAVNWGESWLRDNGYGFLID